MKSRRLSSTQTYSISRLQHKLQEYSLTLPITTQQPSSSTLQQLYSQWNNQNKHEITFDELIFTLLHNPQIKNETISYRPKKICPQQLFNELDGHLKTNNNINQNEIPFETNIFRHLDFILSNNTTNNSTSGGIAGGNNIGSSSNAVGNSNGFDNGSNDGSKGNGTTTSSLSASTSALLPGINK